MSTVFKPRTAEERSVEEPREMGTREFTQETYRPPSMLPDPEPRPGWVHRWVRMSLLNQADDQNVWRMRREGWETCARADYPEYEGMLLRGEGSIEIGGLILCRAPAERMESRKRYYDDLNKRAMQSIDSSLMKEQDSRMPLIVERKSRVSFGSGE